MSVVTINSATENGGGVGGSDGGGGGVWVVVSGASQGFGASICTELATTLPSNSVIIGIARSNQRLKHTADAVHKINANIKFIPVTMDLSEPDNEDFERALSENFDKSSPPSKAMIIHNAGSLGSLKYLQELKDKSELANYFSLNVSSVILLNGAFLRLVNTLDTTPPTYVVNITSLCGIEPSKSWGLYCTSKAAREMLFKVMAAEETRVRVLSYSPGPLDTEMQVLARTETQDEELRDAYQGMKEEGKLLTCEDSVKKLFDILKKDEFKSGERIDFYD